MLALMLVLAGVAVPGAHAPVALAQSPNLDTRALDQLGPAPARKTPLPGHPHSPTPASAGHTAGKTPPGKAVAAKPPPLVVPVAPPEVPLLPPPIMVPARPPPPPTPTPVAADAPGVATLNATGLRVTFGADRTDLNPASVDAITGLVQRAQGTDSSYTVTAYATGGDDPSTPRRLSLSRALAVRSALMQAGVASVRIYVKALGASSPAIADGPPDRADLVVTAGQTPAVPPPTQLPNAPASNSPALNTPALNPKVGP